MNYLKQNKVEILSVGFIILLAIILRVVAIDNFGALWFDELFSWYFASKDGVVQAVSEALKQDIHMPLYFVLLHYWIKLFGDGANTMRWLSFIISLPLVPCGYYLTKNAFGKTAGYFTAAYFAINTYCIYYSLEVRMYSMVLILSFLSAYFFAKMTDKFDRKNTIFYIISLSLLFYTFTITPLLALMNFIVGLIYLLIAKKEKITKFLIAHAIVFVVCLPAIYWTYQNAFEMQHALTYFPLDNHTWNPNMIYDILENFFTTENVQIIGGDTHVYRNMMNLLGNFQYFVFVFIPIIIGLIGLLRAMFSKNAKFYMFFLPSLAFLVVGLILSKLALLSILTRYLTIIFPVFALSAMYGLSLFKNKIVSYALFILFIYCNFAGMFFTQEAVISMHKSENASIANLMAYNVKLRDDDLILNPISSDKLSYYFKKGKYIPFAMDQGFCLKNKESVKFYLGDDAKDMTRPKLKEYLLHDALNDIPSKVYEKNLLEYINKMEKGQRVIYIAFWAYYLVPLKLKGFTSENYKSFNMIDYVFTKIMRDSLIILNKHLKYVTRYEMSEGAYAILIFEKQ